MAVLIDIGSVATTLHGVAFPFVFSWVCPGAQITSQRCKSPLSKSRYICHVMKDSQVPSECCRQTDEVGGRIDRHPFSKAERQDNGDRHPLSQTDRIKSLS